MSSDRDESPFMMSGTASRCLRQEAKEANLASGKVSQSDGWRIDGGTHRPHRFAETTAGDISARHFNKSARDFNKSVQAVEKLRAERMEKVNSVYGTVDKIPVTPGLYGNFPSKSARTETNFFPSKSARTETNFKTPSAPSAAKPGSPRDCTPRYLRSACLRQAKMPIGKLPKITNTQPQPDTSIDESAMDQRGWQIMRLASKMMIQTENAMERIPPNTWLVVEPQTAQLSRSRSSGFINNEYTLFAAAGQGNIVGEAVFQEIPKDQLKISAAEANLRSTARGSSVLALRHAGYIMTLLTDDIVPGREPPPSAVALRAMMNGAVSPCEKVFATRPHDIELQKLGELKKFAEKMETIVAHNSAQKGVRYVLASPFATNRKTATTKSEKAGSFLLQDEEFVSKGRLAHTDFQRFLKQKFGNLFSAWLALDHNGKMSLGETEFYRACASLGYQPALTGMMKELWRYLDRDTSGSVTLLELDPDVGIQLAQFKGWATKRFGPGMINLFHAFDADKSGRITRAEFIQGCANHGYKSAANVFRVLDRACFGVISLPDLTILDKWSPPSWLFVDPDHDALMRFKERLCDMFAGSALRAWRYGLDKDGSMRVSYKEFKDACLRLIRTGVASFNLEGVWRALDADFSGYVSLKEFDAEAHQMLKSFKSWAVATHRGISRAFRAMDKNGVGRVRLKDLKWACHPVLTFEATSMIFKGLLQRDSEFIELINIRFLDEWDPDETYDAEDPHENQKGWEKDLVDSSNSYREKSRYQRMQGNVFVDAKIREMLDKCDPHGDNVLRVGSVYDSCEKHEEVAEFFKHFLGMGTDSRNHVKRFFKEIFDGKEEVPFEEVKGYFFQRNRKHVPSKFAEAIEPRGPSLIEEFKSEKAL